MSRKLKTIAMLLLACAAFGTPLHASSANSEVTVTPPDQTADCAGVVVEESGEPVIGAAVVVKGTSNGVTTNVDGRFKLNGVKRGDALVISCMGYIKQEVRWNGRDLKVTLVSDDKLLEEVVVVGYGTIRKADLAGSVSVMDSKSFKDQPITDVSQALQGRVAGVQVVSSGIPGGDVKIRVRGTNSINNSNEPLYVVDGMVRETGLEGISPEDIQSLQILKDASATAIYGSRGANGVVLISTKSADKGKTQITLDAKVGVATATYLPEVMGTKEYAQSLVDWNGIPASQLSEYLDGTKPGTDWVDEVFQTGVTQQYNLVLAKGTESTKVYFSGNYLNHEGTLLGTNYERYSAKLNVNTDLTKWLSLNVDVRASHGIGKGLGGMELGGYNPLWLAFNYSPCMEIMDENGYYNWDQYGSINANAVSQLSACPSERRRDVFAGHVDLKFNILPGLTFTTSNGIDYHNSQSYSFTPEAYKGAGKGNGASNATATRRLLQTVNNFTYDNTFADKHHLTATAVWEATKSESRSLNGNANNLLTESVGWWNLGVGSVRDASNAYSDWSLMSAVARVVYSYDNRYMFTGTFRADGSSRFTNNKWGYFPSAAVAWTFANEKFFEPLKEVVSNGKLRVSYGVVGNQDITPYSTLATLTQTSVYFNGNQGYTGLWSNKVSTPNLKWEKTNQFDLGLDLSFLNGRIDVTLDYFYKKTTDALLRTSSAAYLGGASYYINAGEVENKGFDLAITARIIQNKDWSWTSTLNGSYNQNKVVKLTAEEPEIYAGSLQSIITDYTIIREGEAIGSLFGYRWAGIKDGLDTYYKADGTITTNPEFEDRVVLGKASPDFTLGWNNTVTWKNWSLNVFFNGEFGMQRLNALRFAMNSKIGNSRAITAAGYAGKIGSTMADPTNPAYAALGESSKYVEDADYLRLENLSLGYTIPRKVSKFADITLTASVQNLFVITGYEGSNPGGFTFHGNGDRMNGVDTGTFPTVRTWTFGARLNF